MENIKQKRNTYKKKKNNTWDNVKKQNWIVDDWN